MSITLAKLLIKKDLLDTDQISTALKYGDESGYDLAKSLSELGYIDENQLLVTLSEEYKVPTVDLDDVKIDEAAILKIPAGTARDNCLIPLTLSGAELTVAMADPSNLLLQDDLSFLTGCTLRAVLASEHKIRAKLKELYGDTAPSGLNLDDQKDSGSFVLEKTISASSKHAKPVDEIMIELESYRSALISSSQAIEPDDSNNDINSDYYKSLAGDETEYGHKFENDVEVDREYSETDNNAVVFGPEFFGSENNTEHVTASDIDDLKSDGHHLDNRDAESSPAASGPDDLNLDMDYSSGTEGLELTDRGDDKSVVGMEIEDESASDEYSACDSYDDGHSDSDIGYVDNLTEKTGDKYEPGLDSIEKMNDAETSDVEYISVLSEKDNESDKLSETEIPVESTVNKNDPFEQIPVQEFNSFSPFSPPEFGSSHISSEQNTALQFTSAEGDVPLGEEKQVNNSEDDTESLSLFMSRGAATEQEEGISKKPDIGAFAATTEICADAQATSETDLTELDEQSSGRMQQSYGPDPLEKIKLGSVNDVNSDNVPTDPAPDNADITQTVSDEYGIESAGKVDGESEIESHTQKALSVLVIDDSPAIQKIVRATLERNGHDVIVAADAIAALSSLYETRPDLILLDIVLPHMDGYQLCKILKSHGLTRDVPVVMLSGRDGFFDKVRGKLAGAKGCITKPFTATEILNAVEKYTETGNIDLHQ